MPVRYFYFAVCLVIFSSCSNYMTSQGRFFSLFSDARYKEAADNLKEQSEKEGRDQILFLIDRGSALFEAGEYKEAIQVFTKAERLSEIKDYTSISEETISIISSDAHKQFRPLDFEKIMINVYLAMSYILIGKEEDSLVECRRINNLIYKLKNAGLKDFEDLAIAWYLSASLYDNQHRYDHSVIDYERAKKLKPSFKYYPKNMKTNRWNICPNCGEVIVIFSSGLAPVKRVDPNNSMLPKFYKRGTSSGYLKVFGSNKTVLAESSELLDLDDVSIRNLEERKGRIIARRLLGVGAKVAVGVGVAKATKNETAGWLAGLLLHSTTRPDLRSWSTLPKSIQVARFELPAGEHEIILQHFNNGSSVGPEHRKKVMVRKHKISFIAYRDI